MENKPLQEITFYDYSGVEIVFSIKTKILDLEKLSKLLGLSSTRGWTMGEKYIGRQLNVNTKELETAERQRLWTMFIYETKGAVDSNKFQTHADHLLNKLQAAQEILKDMAAAPDKFEILVQIYLAFDPDQVNFGFSANADTLSRLACFCQQIEWRNK